MALKYDSIVIHTTVTFQTFRSLTKMCVLRSKGKSDIRTIHVYICVYHESRLNRLVSGSLTLLTTLKNTETREELSTTCNPKVMSRCLSAPDATSLHHCLQNHHQYFTIWTLRDLSKVDLILLSIQQL